MNAKTLWVPLGLVALFAGGVATGILYQRHATDPHADLPPREDHSTYGGAAARHMEQFRGRLNLTDEQAETVKGVLDRVHREAIGLGNEFHRTFETIRSRAWEDIRATLTQEQLPEFEKLVKELEKAHGDHGDSGDHGGHDHGGRGHDR